MSQFYQLRLEEAIADYKAGLITATGLLKYYIKIRFAPGWQIILNPIEVCQLLGLAKVTFYKAIAKLRQLGWNFGKSVQIIGEDLDPVRQKRDPNVNNTDLNVKKAAPSINKIIRSETSTAQNPSQTQQHSDSPNYSSNSYQSSSHSLSKKGEPEKKEKEKDKKENTNTGVNQATSYRKESQNDNSSLVNNSDPVEDKNSAAAHNSQVILLKSDIANKSETALDVNRPSPQTQKEKQFNWVPAGPWCDENNKLNPQFMEWLARDWQKAYGGDLHRKKADVLRHFVKNPANIAISWQQYQSEYLHRYQNVSMRMQHGLEIKPEEQQQLIANHAAVTKPLPDELNTVATEPEPEPAPVRTPALPEKQNSVDCQAIAVTATEPISFSEGKDNSTSTPVAPSHPEGADNPGAYKLFVPKPIEEEPPTPEKLNELKQMLTGLKKNLSMPECR